MKLKIYKQEIKEIETKFDLPVYLYYQDDMCNDELVKITDKEKITIKRDFTGYNITVESVFYVNGNFEKNITTEEHFNEFYRQVLEDLNNAVLKNKLNNYV